MAGMEGFFGAVDLKGDRSFLAEVYLLVCWLMISTVRGAGWGFVTHLGRRRRLSFECRALSV